MSRECPKCGNERIKEDHKFCSICGMKLEGKDDEHLRKI
ncbi:zinc ribbon domain-containing protein [Enterococcus malodoratus]